MKRGGPPERKTPLRADPDTVREFAARGRGALKRTNLARQPSTSSSRPRKSRVTIPAATRTGALARSDGLCIMCVYQAGPVSATKLVTLVRNGTVRAAVHLHHVFPKDDAHWPELALVEDNLVGGCVWCHLNHEFSPTRQIPRAALPACAIALADGHPRRQAYLERKYPVA